MSAARPIQFRSLPRGEAGAQSLSNCRRAAPGQLRAPEGGGREATGGEHLERSK